MFIWGVMPIEEHTERTKLNMSSWLLFLRTKPNLLHRLTNEVKKVQIEKSPLSVFKQAHLSNRERRPGATKKEEAVQTELVVKRTSNPAKLTNAVNSWALLQKSRIFLVILSTNYYKKKEYKATFCFPSPLKEGSTTERSAAFRTRRWRSDQ